MARTQDEEAFLGSRKTYYPFIVTPREVDENADELENASAETPLLGSANSPWSQGGTSTDDAMSYDQGTLMNWSIMLNLKGSAFDNPGVWMMLGQMIVLALVVGLVCSRVPNWNTVDTDKFQRLSTCLTVFVGLMLGFFLSLQMSRWFAAAGAFMDLFDAVRNLQVQCFALGVNPDRTAQIVRYGLLATWLLYFDIKLKSDKKLTKEEAHAQLWKEIEEIRPGLTTEKEKQSLSATKEPSSCIWAWVASLVGRMAEDGDIPPMASPTYGRIMQLAQNAHGAIRDVNMNVVVNTPYVYAHMLALLVHCNNILSAVSFGMTLGVTFSQVEQGFNRHVIGKIVQANVSAALLSFIAPFLYQAMLEVSLAVAQPFGHEDAVIPVPKLMRGLERDLDDCAMLADSTPEWEKPYFKKPA